MAKADLTAARLREILSYDPETGIFRWRIDVGRWGRIKAGTITDSRNVYGHVQINIDAVPKYAHRLAWLYVYGKWPDADIDHIDGNKANNAIANLRDVPRAINNQNLTKQRGSHKKEPLGVNFDKKRGRWRASICADGKRRFLGRFKTVEEAQSAYLSAKRKYHPGCTI